MRGEGKRGVVVRVKKGGEKWVVLIVYDMVRINGLTNLSDLRKFPDSEGGVCHVVIVIVALSVTSKTPPLSRTTVSIDRGAGDRVNLLRPATRSHFLWGGGGGREGCQKSGWGEGEQ